MVVLGQVQIENSSLPVAVRVSKTRVLKLPNLDALPRDFKRAIYALEKIFSKEMKEYNKITHSSIAMDILCVFWEFR